MAEPARDLTGYAAHPPRHRWPGGAGLALNFVINYEEGSEYSVPDGDGRSETALIEVSAPRVPAGERDLAAESMYEYGARVGVWRLFRLFQSRGLSPTIFAAAQALERNPEVAAAIAATDWDIACHGWRWIEHYRLDEATERDHIARAHASICRLIGRAPGGWYSRYSRSLNTRRLVAEHGGYEYDSDAYNDELPYWRSEPGGPHLVVPYTLVTNDAKFLQGGLVSGRDFADFLIDGFDVLLREAAEEPRLMSVGLHPRVIGHPARFRGLEIFLDHVARAQGVWVARRLDIARHWKAVSPAGAP